MALRADYSLEVGAHCLILEAAGEKFADVRRFYNWNATKWGNTQMVRPRLKLPNGRFKKATRHYNNKRIMITAKDNQLIWLNWKQEKEEKSLAVIEITLIIITGKLIN